MNRLATGVATMSLAAAAACGNPEVSAEAHINGFAYGIDAEIVEDQWVLHTDQDRKPAKSEYIRDVSSHRDFDGCEEVDNDFFSFNNDDPKCTFRFDCISSKETHCEAQYVTRYDFRRLEEVVVKHCVAPLVKSEYKHPEPEINQACIDRRTPDQRVHQTARYMIYVTAHNPKYDPKKPTKNGPEILATGIAVSADQWEQADYSTKAKAIIRDGRIVDVKLG